MSNYWNFFVSSFSWNDIFSIIACIFLLLYVKFADLQKLWSSRSEVFLHRYVSRNFLKFLIIFPYIFLNLGIVVFKKHLSVAAFKVITIHSLFSFIFILFEFVTNHILEHFLFNIRSLQSVVSFYIYVYDAWTGSMSLNCLYG